MLAFVGQFGKLKISIKFDRLTNRAIVLECLNPARRKSGYVSDGIKKSSPVKFSHGFPGKVSGA